MDRIEPQPGVAQVVVGALEAAQRLLTANVALARAEVDRKAREGARLAAVGALAMVPALAGWALCLLAMAVLLSGALGLVWALLLVGGLNLGAGVLLFVRGTRRVRGA